MKKTLLLDLDPDCSYLLCTHREPDPDGLGALLALWSYGINQGMSIKAYVDHYPSYMSWMPGLSELKNPDYEDLASDFCLIALDCGQLSRIWPADIAAKAFSLINIDHHLDNDAFGQHNFIDTEVSSTCELLFNYMEHYQVSRSEDINENLLAGILFDTGGLRYPNTHPNTLSVVSQLMKDGASLTAISEKVFNRWTRQSYIALELALANISFPLGEEFLLSWIPFESINQAGLKDLDFEGVVQVLREHYCAQIIVLVRETRLGKYKASLRSKGKFAVHDIAHHFHGGGHAQAAGFIAKTTSGEALKQEILTLVREKLL